MKFKFLATALLASACLIAPQAHATDAKDLQVIGRALSFVEGGATGDITVAVVYDDGSKAEAESVVALMDGGIKAGKVNMSAKLVAVSDLGSAGDAAAIFVPSGMASHYEAIKGSGKLTATTDKACVQDGACVVFVQSSPKVEILVSQAAAAASSVSFAAAFRMMIKEV